jgi:serine/threonine protein phosphatase PrpC
VAYWNAVWTKTCITSDVELKKKDLYGGSTGVFALIFTEFVGDSRCTLFQCEGGGCLESTVRPLAFDHKPDNLVEFQRFTNAGMKLETRKATSVESRRTSRVLSWMERTEMSVSRAFGDFECKEKAKLGPEGQAALVAFLTLSSTNR